MVELALGMRGEDELDVLSKMEMLEDCEKPKLVPYESALVAVADGVILAVLLEGEVSLATPSEPVSSNDIELPNTISVTVTWTTVVLRTQAVISGAVPAVRAARGYTAASPLCDHACS